MDVKQLQEEALQSINEFCDYFEEKFGTRPRVFLNKRTIGLDKLSIPELQSIVNKVMSENASTIPNTWTIKIQSRKKEVIMYRQSFYKIARDMGHSTVAISSAMGYDHATVCYACRRVMELLETGDKEMQEVYERIYYEVQKYIADGGSLKVNSKGSDTKPAISPKVYPGLNPNKPTDKSSSRSTVARE